MKESNASKQTPKRGKGRKSASHVDKDESLVEEVETEDGNDAVRYADDASPVTVKHKRSRSSVAHKSGDVNSSGEDSGAGDVSENNGSDKMGTGTKNKEPRDKGLALSSDEGGSTRNRRKSRNPQRRGTCQDEAEDLAGETTKPEGKQRGRKSRKQGQPKRSTVDQIYGDHVTDMEMDELMRKFGNSEEDWEEEITPTKKKRQGRAKKPPPTPLVSHSFLYCQIC